MPRKSRNKQLELYEVQVSSLIIKVDQLDSHVFARIKGVLTWIYFHWKRTFTFNLLLNNVAQVLDSQKLRNQLCIIAVAQDAVKVDSVMTGHSLASRAEILKLE